MKKIFEKPYIWSFLGQVKGKPTRENMLAELKQVRGEHFIHITEKWNDAKQISVQEYKQILSDSIFVPCPSGWGGDRGLKDCFRLYEALEAGSIPIVEKDDFQYFDKFFPGHPFLQIPSDWQGIGKDLESLLSEPDKLQKYNQELLLWWSDYKTNLKSKITANLTSQQISVIIPTIWMANDYLKNSLNELEKNQYVSEVLIVNNKVESTPDWINDFTKVKLLNQKQNLYFNGSVNLAVPLCSSNLCCVLNDDANIDVLAFQFISELNNKDFGCIFMNPRCIEGESVPEGHLFDGSHFQSKQQITPYEKFFNHGPGMFFCLQVDKFKPIPDNLKHHCGDRFIFQNNIERGLKNYFLEGFRLQIPTTGSLSRKGSEVEQVISNDYIERDKVFNLNNIETIKTCFTSIDRNIKIQNKWAVILHKLKSGCNVFAATSNLYSVDKKQKIQQYIDADTDIALCEHNYNAWGCNIESLLSSVYIYIKHSPRTIALIEALHFQLSNIQEDDRFFSYKEQYADYELQKLIESQGGGLKIKKIKNDTFAISEEIYGKNIEHYKSNPPAYINFDRNVYTEELKKVYFDASSNTK